MNARVRKTFNPPKKEKRYAQRRELEDAGLFPHRVYISERKHGYIEEEIDAYVEARIRERDTMLAAKQTAAEPTDRKGVRP